jgi:hypothetical protein
LRSIEILRYSQSSTPVFSDRLFALLTAYFIDPSNRLRLWIFDAVGEEDIAAKIEELEEKLEATKT